MGCCSLRVEHINLYPEKDGQEFVVEFDFLGKDSIRYYNKVPVEKRVRMVDERSGTMRPLFFFSFGLKCVLLSLRRSRTFSCSWKTRPQRMTCLTG